MENETKKTSSQIKIEEINKVEGFEPSEFAVDYTDLEDQKTHKRLPVTVQIAWFRMKYPTGKIALDVAKSGEYFVAKARIYADYKDPVESYLSEATASRCKSEDNPNISVREWAQTAAIGVALRNAGFGLQFTLIGELPTEEDKELGKGKSVTVDTEDTEAPASQVENIKDDGITDDNLPLEERYKLALKVECPVSKYAGKTLEEVLRADYNLIRWLADKYEKDPLVKKAAATICEYASKHAA